MEITTSTKSFTWKAQLGASLVLGVFIVLHNQSVPLRRIITNLGFYLSVMASAIIALLLMRMVARITDWIATNPRWQQNDYGRFLIQLLAGALLPCLVALALAFGLLEGLGNGFVKSGYLTHEFPLVCQFIVVLNLSYLTIYYRSLAIATDKALVQTQESLVKTQDSLAHTQGALAHTQDKLADAQDALVQSQEALKSTVKEMELLEKVVRSKRREIQLPADWADGLPECHPKLLKLRIKVMRSHGWEWVEIEKVVYLKWHGRNVWAALHTGSEFKVAANSLKTVAGQLPPYWFLCATKTMVIGRKYLLEGTRVVDQHRKMVIKLRWKRKVVPLSLSKYGISSFLEWEQWEAM